MRKLYWETDSEPEDEGDEFPTYAKVLSALKAQRALEDASSDGNQQHEVKGQDPAPPQKPAQKPTPYAAVNVTSSSSSAPSALRKP